MGPIDWQRHSQGRDSTWYSVHGVGLPVLLAPVFRTFGVTGVRVALALLAAVIPFVLFAIARTRGIRSSESVVLAVGASFGLPFLAAAGQVYPDLVTGVLLLVVTYLLLLGEDGRLLQRHRVPLSVALFLLPWLHVKNAACGAALGFALVIVEWRNGRGGIRRWQCLWPGAPVAVSLTLLALYNWMAFGNMAGPVERVAPASATLNQAAMIFAGIHIDQAQGVFVQQPLFLLGLSGLVNFACRSPLACAGVTAAYLAERCRTRSTSVGTGATR